MARTSKKEETLSVHTLIPSGAHVPCGRKKETPFGHTLIPSGARVPCGRKEESMEPIWKAGIYARLSVDNNTRKNESIDTQIAIAKEFISQADDIELAACYSDLGKTGTNFNRDGFERMMADIRRKEINCVIVKDFSRFGRNYIETGNYIEKIFPFMKVRFIAVTDGYDSEHLSGDSDQLSMNLKNIVNELYARDIGQRVSMAKKMKQEMGSYTGGIAPYGYYVRQVGDRKVLFPDDTTKDIVVRIFEEYADGHSRKEIITELYQKRVRPPMSYRATKEVYCPKEEALRQWPPDTIKNILTNPVYIGTLFQSRVCGRDCRGHKRHEIPEGSIAVVEHTHEPLISEDLFYKVSQRLEEQSKYSNKKGFSKAVPHSEDIWKDKVYCGECGHCMVRRSCVRTLASGDCVRHYYYACPNHGRIDNNACKCQSVSLGVLEKVLKSVLEKEFALFGMRQKDYCKENQKEADKKKAMLQKQKSEAVRQQEALALAESRLYLRYREQELSREAFLEEKEKAEEERKALKKQEVDCAKKEEQIDQKVDRVNQSIRAMIRCKNNSKFDREFIECMIQKVHVYEGHQVEIIWNYREHSLLYGRDAYE